MEALLKKPSKLEYCKEGTKVILNFSNGEEYTGLFKGVEDEETIILQSLKSKATIGLPFNKLINYLEEV